MTELPGLSWIRQDTAVIVWHPERGEVTACPIGQVEYQELTQRERGVHNPWVPTGGIYRGFRLEPELLLLNWQNRFYLLDSRELLTDDDVRRDFVKPAQRFGASDQAAEVTFQLADSTRWKIDDIGRFRISKVSGEWYPAAIGSTARFLHASADGERALVVEDFEGGGQDTLWRGYRVQERDIRSL
jgi:hypothetical protein